MRPMERDADVFARRSGQPYARIRRDDSSRVGHSTRESIRAKWIAYIQNFHRAYEASARRAPSPIDGPAGRCLRQSTIRVRYV